jgi:hypothetical protein
MLQPERGLAMLPTISDFLKDTMGKGLKKVLKPASLFSQMDVSI